VGKGGIREYKRQNLLGGWVWEARHFYCYRNLIMLVLWGGV
jgi:hypothetical protein